MSLPKVIPKEMLERKSGSTTSISSSEKSVKYMKTTSGTVDVISRRSRSIDTIELPKAAKNR